MDLTPALAALGDKQRLYVQARLEGDAPSVAARRAGIKDPSQSWRLMEKQPEVVAALKAGREISIAATGITRETIVGMLQEAYRNATNSMEQIAAARELGKLLGLYEANKLQVEHKMEGIRHERELRTLSVTELEKLAALDGEFIDVTPRQEKALVRIAS